MDIQNFREVIEQIKNYLLYDQDMTIGELIAKAKNNERIRALTVFYVIKDEETFADVYENSAS